MKSAKAFPFLALPHELQLEVFRHYFAGCYLIPERMSRDKYQPPNNLLQYPQSPTDGSPYTYSVCPFDRSKDDALLRVFPPASHILCAFSVFRFAAYNVDFLGLNSALEHFSTLPKKHTAGRMQHVELVVNLRHYDILEGRFVPFPRSTLMDIDEAGTYGCRLGSIYIPILGLFSGHQIRRKTFCLTLDGCWAEMLRTSRDFSGKPFFKAIGCLIGFERVVLRLHCTATSFVERHGIGPETPPWQ